MVVASLLERAVRLLYGSGRKGPPPWPQAPSRIVADRGFGFITGQDGKDYFFHRDSLVPPLSFDRLDGGEPVTYEVEDGPKGPRASKVSGA